MLLYYEDYGTYQALYCLDSCHELREMVFTRPSAPCYGDMYWGVVRAYTRNQQGCFIGLDGNEEGLLNRADCLNETLPSLGSMILVQIAQEGYREKLARLSRKVSWCLVAEDGHSHYIAQSVIVFPFDPPRVQYAKTFVEEEKHCIPETDCGILIRSCLKGHSKKSMEDHIKEAHRQWEEFLKKVQRIQGKPQRVYCGPCPVDEKLKALVSSCVNTVFVISSYHSENLYRKLKKLGIEDRYLSVVIANEKYSHGIDLNSVLHQGRKITVQGGSIVIEHTSMGWIFDCNGGDSSLSFDHLNEAMLTIIVDYVKTYQLSGRIYIDFVGYIRRSFEKKVYVLFQGLSLFSKISKTQGGVFEVCLLRLRCGYFDYFMPAVLAVYCKMRQIERMYQQKDSIFPLEMEILPREEPLMRKILGTMDKKYDMFLKLTIQRD